MLRNISIGGREIGPESPCFIIAEGCDNHLGNMETAKEMVRQAKACGADAIKFQHHLADEEMLRALVDAAGFKARKIERVPIAVEGVSAREVATGQVRGTPRGLLLSKRGVDHDVRPVRPSQLSDPVAHIRTCHHRLMCAELVGERQFRLAAADRYDPGP